MKRKREMTTKIVIVALMFFAVIDWIILKNIKIKPRLIEENLIELNASELARHNGDDATLPVYLALDGYVYDVTPGAVDFYGPGQSYHDLAGKDSSIPLHVIGGDIIKKKYKVIGVYKP